jgi:hypothetical protein
VRPPDHPGHFPIDPHGGVFPLELIRRRELKIEPSLVVGASLGLPFVKVRHRARPQRRPRHPRIPLQGSEEITVSFGEFHDAAKLSDERFGSTHKPMENTEDNPSSNNLGFFSVRLLSKQAGALNPCLYLLSVVKLFCSVARWPALRLSVANKNLRDRPGFSQTGLL